MLRDVTPFKAEERKKRPHPIRGAFNAGKIWKIINLTALFIEKSFFGRHTVLYRKIEPLIESHLKSGSKKILLVDGARQVGKTYIIRHVGQKLFENYIEINMAEDSLGDQLFSNVRTTEDFYLQVSMIAGNKMQQKSNTLIFIDEI